MNTEVKIKGLEEACKDITMVLKASQAMRAFGRIAMPDTSTADEQLEGVKRSEVASVLEFFGEFIEENAMLAYEHMHRAGIDVNTALVSARTSTSAQAA